MKAIKFFLAAAVLAVSVAAAPEAKAAGPFKFGVKAGLTMNSLKFNEKVFDADNRSGFTVGGMVEFGTPLGFGVDASVMFTRRFSKVSVTGDDGKELGSTSMNRSYIEIPVNLRWNFSLPGVSQFISPYLATGPDFSILASKKAINEAYKNRTFDVAWNFGLGVQIVKRVEIGASYGIGITNSATGPDSLYGKPFNGKNRFWTVTAAYLF